MTKGSPSPLEIDMHRGILIIKSILNSTADKHILMYLIFDQYIDDCQYSFDSFSTKRIIFIIFIQEIFTASNIVNAHTNYLRKNILILLKYADDRVKYHFLFEDSRTLMIFLIGCQLLRVQYDCSQWLLVSTW